MCSLNNSFSNQQKREVLFNKMFKPLEVLLLLTITNCVLSSPLLLSEKYIEDFKHGIEELKKAANEHSFKEEDFHQIVGNETEIEKDPEHYDFIVVGAGGSGAVVANRLSERPEWKVLLLEAGPPETEFTKIPGLGYYLRTSHYNWGYHTTSQKTWCQGMIENQCPLLGGKVLGGSTAINGMLYTRGNQKDYDLWADLGNNGWCFNDVLPYFKKAEDADLQHYDHEYHNRGGPFHVEHPPHLNKLVETTLDAAKELGLEIVDYNGKHQLGVGLAQVSSRHGKRESTASAYLEPAHKRKNLVVKTLSHVTKVLIAPHTKECTGVEYVHDGKLHHVRADKEVILSAGAIQTPKLLMLSGIGPKEDLEKLEIPLVKDLNVGKIFKDHIAFFGFDLIHNETETEEEEEKHDEVEEYLKHGKGPLSTFGWGNVGYLHTEASKDATKYPDVEIFFISKKLHSTPGKNTFSIKPEVFESLWKELDDKKSVNIGVMLAHPKSTGHLTLKDKDPFHHPLINPNQLSDPEDHDLKTLLAGIRKAQSFAKTEAVKKLNLVLNENKVHGCEEHEWDSDDYWKCAIRHLTITLNHFTGTAKMGPIEDKDAVVDEKLKVYGVHKLRVVDNSVIPVTITGHTMAPAIMIGEKAADLIKETWK